MTSCEIKKLSDEIENLRLKYLFEEVGDMASLMSDEHQNDFLLSLTSLDMAHRQMNILYHKLKKEEYNQ